MTKMRRVPGPWLEALRDEDTGELVGPYVPSRISVPASLRIAGQRLIYQRVKGRREPQEVTPQRGLLEQFLHLATNPTDERVLRFAQRWGPLAICGHNQSLFRHLECEPRRMAPNEAGDWQRVECWEPLDTWRRLSREANAFLKMADSLRRGELVGKTDAAVFGRDVAKRYAGEVERPLVKDQVAGQRKLLALDFSAGMISAGVHPWVTWEEREPISMLGYVGVMGAVAAQLFVVIGGSSFTTCAGCGKLFPPRRQPRAGEKSWCPLSRCRQRMRAAASKASRDAKRALKQPTAKR